MAKQINYTQRDTGAVFPLAYFRISKIEIARNNVSTLMVTYDGYANAEAATTGKAPICRKTTKVENFVITETDDIRALIYAQDKDLFFKGNAKV